MNTKHGKAKTKIYNIYYGMRDRCYNTNRSQYTDYGGRGIVVCQEWLDDFMNFYNWAIDNGYKDGLTIEQALELEKRHNKHYTINGESHRLIDWCRILNLNYKLVHCRICRGWSIEKALELEGK